MMTLLELMDRVDDATAGGARPTVQMMINPENPVVAKESMGDDIYIAVFANGYVFYKNSRHMTFFPLHSCRDNSEKDVMGEDHVVPFSVFSDQPWQMRVFMEGEKRLVHNANSSRGYAGEISYDAFSVDSFLVSDGGASDPLTIMVEEICREEEHDLLVQALGRLTDRQRFMLFEWVLTGKTQEEIACAISSTRANVATTLKKSLRKLRVSFGIEEIYVPSREGVKKG